MWGLVGCLLNSTCPVGLSAGYFVDGRSGYELCLVGKWLDHSGIHPLPGRILMEGHLLFGQRGGGREQSGPKNVLGGEDFCVFGVECVFVR